ncbi:ACP S-malonyltransferase [Nocardiopsis sp. L17-MgMaSL7]|uniref:ACP S-malonyltransferase n=1 Tax=Nocardiopsis sp. L17-MgMaSL7 TaxID=1938893 RepID=UPI000D709E3F|nr:ACP S-malonyltransferase [Nocardiopsis sp. L17-MgMaSL7]PWV57402.1 [acyl-carrier-protein] S-malonyltransferase [Nocardiopsis sp. L17-MgMaSL7]
MSQRTAILFNPQVAMRPGDYRDLYEALPLVRRRLEQASEAIGVDLDGAFHSADADLVNQGPLIRPMSVALGVALYESLPAEYRDGAEYMAGLSLGQITAAAACGALSFDDAVRTVRTMATVEGEVFAGRDYGSTFCYCVDLESVFARIGELTAQGLDAAPCAITGDDQMVVSGEAAALTSVNELAAAGGGVGVRIPHGPPGHSPMLAPAEERFAAEWEQRERVRTPRVPLLCNMDSTPLATAEEVRDALITQYTRTVHWSRGIERLLELGTTRFVVVGPGHFIGKSFRFMTLAKRASVVRFDQASSFTEELAGRS